MHLRHFISGALLLLSSACHSVYQHSAPQAKLYTLQSPAQDSAIAADFLTPYRTAMQAQMDVVIGFNDTVLTKAKPDGNLGHMVADAMLAAARTKVPQTQLSVCNYGGIRVPSVGKGKISLGTVYEIMPFDNTVVVVTLNGVQLDSMCQNAARGGGLPVAGISFTIKNNAAQNITVQGQALDYDTDYYVAVNDYMANGGDNMEYLKKLPRQDCNILLRDAIVNYVKQQQSANASLWQAPFKRISK
jgi:2',3'-cyclic-nucleotide 2'-phosphodiesterase (5'-nucleotidase family)